MTHWSDEYTDEEIEELKGNEKMWTFLNEKLASALRKKIPDEDLLECFGSTPEFSPFNELEDRNTYWVYRLRPDWERPGKEEKKYKVVEYKFKPIQYDDLTTYSVSVKGMLLSLSSVANYKGFIGYKFKETGDKVFKTPVVWLNKYGNIVDFPHNVTNGTCDYKAVATPQSVVFMEEE